MFFISNWGEKEHILFPNNFITLSECHRKIYQRLGIQQIKGSGQSPFGFIKLASVSQDFIQRPN